MKSVARQTLALVLLLTQAVTMVTGSAFTRCISPAGRECIETPWTTCTCCQDDGRPNPDNQSPGVAGDDTPCQAEQGCSCHRDHREPSAAASPYDTTALDPAAWNEHPCRCKHYPLIAANEVQQTPAERITVGDRDALDQFLSAPVTSLLGGFSPSRDTVALLPQPPPSGHLLAISCTVLRC